METRKLAFVIALTAGATTAVNQIPDLLVQEVQAGTNETRSLHFNIEDADFPAALDTMINNYLTSKVQPMAQAKWGDVLDPATVAYDIRILRNGNGIRSIHGKVKGLPVFTTERPPAPPPEPPEIVEP